MYYFVVSLVELVFFEVGVEDAEYFAILPLQYFVGVFAVGFGQGFDGGKFAYLGGEVGYPGLFFFRAGLVVEQGCFLLYPVGDAFYYLVEVGYEAFVVAWLGGETVEYLKGLFKFFHFAKLALVELA